MLELVTISTLNGVLYGMLLFLMASGLTLIFSMMGVLNFAHASFYMLGAFFGFQIGQILGFWPAFIVAPVLVGGIGALVERYGLRNVHQARPRRRALVHVWARLRHRRNRADDLGQGSGGYRVPASLDFSAFTAFSTNYPAYKIFELLTAIAIFAVLLAVLTRTRVGLIIQASLTHSHMVAMLGHNVPRVFIAGVRRRRRTSAVAGVIAGPALVTQSNMAGLLGPILFVVVVVGGLRLARRRLSGLAADRAGPDVCRFHQPLGRGRTRRRRRRAAGRRSAVRPVECDGGESLRSFPTCCWC